ncbi:MAG: PCRF domain-containing protein [Patescibacteria group bacterium]
MKKEEIEAKIEALEAEMAGADFWLDKVKAQAVVKEHRELKASLIAGAGGQYDAGDAVMTLFAGAGGDDAEDFARMLFEMYQKFATRRGFEVYLIHQNENNHGGYRNLTFEMRGEKAYGTLKGESGVHRLVRLSPFNAKSLRHTSFALVEVIPKLEKGGAVVIDEKDLKIEFTRSSGPGGQNVNKRETAVRVVHLPTNLSAHSESERSQERNRETAIQILRGKLYKRQEEEREKKEQGMYISKTADIEWGNQIRSYVLHPYKLVKDHKRDIETRDAEGVLNGEIELFL